MDLSASPEKVWALIGQFADLASVDRQDSAVRRGVGQLRTIETIDGKQIIERLEAMDNSQRIYRYTKVSGIPGVDYTGTFRRKAEGSWQLSQVARSSILADGQPDILVKTIVSSLLKTSLESLKKRFGVAK